MKKVFLLLLLTISIVITGCSKDDNPTQPSQGNSDIPADPADIVVPTPVKNNLQPSCPAPVRTSGNDSRIKINLIGLVDPVTNQTITFTPNQTIFVTEDNKVKGIKVSSVGGGTSLEADIVFVVDNSGSMSEEGDSIASKIVQFVEKLQANGLNIRVGCVGYDGDVTGAINLTDAASLKKYLNREYYTGTSRTTEFAGPDSARLATAADSYGSGVYGENGIVGIYFADSLFTWRATASRVYINFTDEGTQPGSSEWFKTSAFKKHWINKGTVHTVFSLEDSYWNGAQPDTSRENENYSDWNSQYERPWALSWASSGTIKFIHSDATDLDLTQLPVVGALSKSVLVEYITADPNKTHDVVITIKNGTTADGRTEFKGIKY